MSHLDDISDGSDDALEPNTLDDEDEWKDVEPDDLAPSFVSFGGSTRFPTIERFLEDGKKNYGVDLIEIQRQNNLDTFGMIKLINFVRVHVSQGLFRPDTSPEKFLEGNDYLKPVLDDDALLYSIDDIFDLCKGNPNVHRPDGLNETPLAEEDFEDLKQKCDQLREQVAYYRSALQTTYLEKMDLQEQNIVEKSETQSDGETNSRSTKEKDDSHYFTSYAYNEIHEIMLQDKVRTDAYRDFIYDNKNLFAGKVVLDVGCGTGILSLFCAKAGAAKVIAVDNSSIIDKAREIVFENGFGDTIQCLRGKIEEVALPVKKVDVIVSEWMGYCLLYEAMLDSVIWARDRYLAPGGLMVPSHATLRLSLFADDDYITDKFAFWNSVYGFKMSCMQEKAYDDIIIRTVRPNAVPSRSETFLELPLHTVKQDDLTVRGACFGLTAERETDDLHGFVIHFDIFFTRDHTETLSAAKVGFTTSPLAAETHWQQALALIDSSKSRAPSLKTGDQVHGQIALRKGSTNFRELEIDIEWKLISADEDGSSSKIMQQTWQMR
ncbi:MAG: hypothetical protein Q9174_002584 [Haloplaca sp. 1 TL-2023]